MKRKTISLKTSNLFTTRVEKYSIGEELRAKTITELRKSLNIFDNDNIRAILLYGSTAKGEAKLSSDVDIIVILNDTKVSPVFLSQEEINFSQVLFENISRTIHFPAPRLLLESPTENKDVINFFFMDHTSVTGPGKQFVVPRNNGKMIDKEWIIIARTAEEESVIKQEIQNQLNCVQ